LSEIGHSLSPPCPLPRGVVHCPRSDSSHHPPVLYREGWFFVQNWTFLLTPLVLYKEGRSFVRDRLLSSSPPCPLPRGVVHCPRSDFPHHPSVLYREGWFFVQNWTFLLTPLVLYQEGWSFVRDRTFFITPLSSTERGGLLSKIGLSFVTPLSSTEMGGLLSKIGLSSRGLILVFFPLFNEVTSSGSSFFTEALIPPLIFIEVMLLNVIFYRGYASQCDFLPRLCSSL